MRPYFENDLVALYHGDLFDVLAELRPLEADAVITDPPYCSGAAGQAVKRAPEVKYAQGGDALGRPSFGGDCKDSHAFGWWCLQWMRLCRRHVRQAGYALVFTDWRQMATTTDALQGADWIHRGTIAWDKGHGARAPHKGYFRHQCEYVPWATNGQCLKRGDAGPFPGCHHVATRKADKWHLTGKPTQLLRDLVQVVPPGGLVLDPFAGSGTTLVAAAAEGRRAIGIEREEDYCRIAADRLAGT